MNPFSNIITLSDSYKVSHYKQYPPGTQYVRSYFESRSGATYPDTVFFGLQYFIKRYLLGNDVITQEKIDDAEKKWNAHLGPGVFNKAGWQSMLEKHKGALPVRIRAVPEGLRIPESNVLMTIENTDPEFYWLTNYLETLLVQVWYPSTVASRSYNMKQTILGALEKSGDPGLIDFKLHDFGFRGVSSVETAALGSAAHLLNFKGTDTFAGCEMLMDYYNAGMPGFSIPAAEHSTITSWGKEHEVDAYRNMLVQYPKGLVAVVSDSFDVVNACSNLWGGVLKERVVARDGVLVVRPDSGDPCQMVPQVIAALADRFGAVQNSKGYAVLHHKVRVIQGDGISDESLPGILDAVMAAGYSADNIAFGSGGGLLQMVNRDTQRFAFKCCSVTVDGVDRDVYKQPKTDSTKNSKRGELKLVKFGTGYHTVNLLDPGQDILVPVFDTGHLLVDYTLDQVRANTLV